MGITALIYSKERKPNGERLLYKCADAAPEPLWRRVRAYVGVNGLKRRIYYVQFGWYRRTFALAPILGGKGFFNVCVKCWLTGTFFAPFTGVWVEIM